MAQAAITTRQADGDEKKETIATPGAVAMVTCLEHQA